MFVDQQNYMISHVGPMEIDEIPHLGRRLQNCDGWGRGKEATFHDDDDDDIYPHD